MDPTEFRRCLGHFATGVTVITTKFNGEPHGMTANAFSSVSLDPPLILVCVAKTSNTHEPMVKAHRFVVNILSKEQAQLAGLFASKERDISRVDLDEGDYGPLLLGSIATLECETFNSFPGGDHTIVLGKVERLQIKGGEPLIFYQGRYAELEMNE